ncbi:MAG TPA: SMP-30/gluconolactonase/LRE family protein [Solirubrobacteraceae bacterium]|jgi:hypothetical protein
MHIRALVLAISVSAGALVGLLGATSALAAERPGAITNEASEVKRATAVLNGFIFAHEAATTYYFEYGTALCDVAAQTCGVKTPTRGPIAEEGSAEPLKLTRLKPGTTYHFRLVANNIEGTSYGAEETFTTVVAEPKEYIFDKNIEVASPFGIGINQATGDVYVSGFTSRTIGQYHEDALKSSIKIPETGGNNLTQLAVDNSGINGEQGDVYVVDPSSKIVYKFDPNTEGALELDKTNPAIGQGHLSRPWGVAVDASGNVYVANTDTGDVSKFSPTGAVLNENLITGTSSPRALTVDAEGNIYVAGESGTVEYTSAGICVSACTPIDPSFDLGVALDSANNLFIATLGPSTVKKYGPGEVRRVIANPVLEREGTFANEPFALAVDNTTHELYVTEFEGAVKVFRFLEAKPVIVKTEPATQVNGPVEALNGKVNPDGQEPAEYYFEYGTSPCLAETCGTVAMEPGQFRLTGDEEIPVSVRLENLAPNTTYHYRIVGVNEESGVEYGEEQTFTTGGPASSPPARAPEGSAPVSGTPASSPVYPLLTNIVPVPPPKEVVPDTLTRAQHLAKALAACNRKPKKQRAACKRQARRKYGPVTKGVAKKHRK